jgi:hypothetical protein
VDDAVVPETEYHYDIAAENYRGRSNVSSELDVTTFVQPPAVTFTQIPVDSQLYARDRVTNLAEVAIVGAIESGAFDQIILRTYRDDVVFGAEIVRPLEYVDGQAACDFRFDINAELSEYDFELRVASGATFAELTNVENVVAGDIFVIQGQSNADAQQYVGSASANEGPFLRTFGINSSAPATTQANIAWQEARGDGSNGRVAGVGQWAIGLGRQLIDEYQVPIAIFNGAHGGRPIDFFQRNDGNPLDLNTNYGRLLYRAQMANVADSVRGILWYQGESDNGAGQIHEDGFVELYNDWHADFPEVEKIYVHQLRVGCGVTAADVDLRDRQRRLPDRFEDIVTVSTTGIDAHDGCHYGYANGYEEIGNRAFNLVGRDLYNEPAAANIESPNVDLAYFSSPSYDEITLVMRNSTDTLLFDNGAESDFRIDGVNVTVTAGQTLGNTVVLTLSGDARDATGIAYMGHVGAGSWVTNAAGVGMLTFFESDIHDGSSTFSVASVELNSTMVDPPNRPDGVQQPTSWQLQRSDLRSLQVNLSFPATVQLDDIVLTSLGRDADVDADSVIELTPQQFAATEMSFNLTFSAEEIPEGVLQLELSGELVDRLGRTLDGNADGQPGDDYLLQGDSTNRFYKLEADWNGDLGVSVFDFTTFSYWFGHAEPVSPAYVDLNRDGGVSVFDFTGFSLNFGAGIGFPVGLASVDFILESGESHFEETTNDVFGFDLQPTQRSDATWIDALARQQRNQNDGFFDEIQSASDWLDEALFDADWLNVLGAGNG